MKMNNIKTWQEMRDQYRSGEYRISAEIAERLIRSILADIHSETFQSKPQHEQKAILTEVHTNYPDLEVKSVSTCNINELSQVFKVTNFLNEKASGTLSLNLIESFQLHKLANMIDLCKSTKSRSADNKITRIAMQQIIQFATLLMFINEEIDLAEEDFIDGLHADGSSILSKDLRDKGFEERFFMIHSSRGLLLNTDRKRNIAFKVDTFLNLLSCIFQETKEQFSLLKHEQPELLSRGIIFESGFDSGQRFGKSMQEMFQNEAEILSIEAKIKKWCEFDSDVGFGHFKDNIKINDKNVEGNISIKENFLVYGKEANDDNICGFMRGYIQGVLEKLTGMPLIVKHLKEDCAQFKIDRSGTSECVFHISVNDEERYKQIEEMKSINFKEEL